MQSVLPITVAADKLVSSEVRAGSDNVRWHKGNGSITPQVESVEGRVSEVGMEEDFMYS